MDNQSKLRLLLQNLAPVRNLNAIRAYIQIERPNFRLGFDLLMRDTAHGNHTASTIIKFMMYAFAAGRAYQEANPDAPRDPDGYE